MAEKSGPQEGVEGVVEGAKGKAKEVFGAVTGRDDMKREGQAQQDKADAQRDAAKKEAEAEAARGSAEASEQRQEAIRLLDTLLRTRPTVNRRQVVSAGRSESPRDGPASLRRSRTPLRPLRFLVRWRRRRR